MNEPLISVIVPLYNKERWVKRTLISILNQTYQNIEILVINDGSTDKSRDLVTSFNDTRITIYDKQNGGLSSARNYGIKKSKGEYFAFIDADDEWRPKHLEMMLKGFRYSNNTVLVCSDLIEIYNNDKVMKTRRELPFLVDDNNVQYHLIKNYFKTLKNGFFILSGSSVLIKTKTIKQEDLLFYTEAQPAEDINYWIRLKDLGDFVFCDYIGLYYHRVDENSIMNKKFIKSQPIPPFLYNVDVDSYDADTKSDLKKFIIKEYFKKGFQNRGLALEKNELSSQYFDMKLPLWSKVIYLAIRYTPDFVFSIKNHLLQIRFKV